MVDKRWPGGQHHSSDFFRKKNKGMLTWLQIDIQQYGNYLYNRPIVKNQTGLTFDDRATIHRFMNIQTLKDIGVPRDHSDCLVSSGTSFGRSCF